MENSRQHWVSRSFLQSNNHQIFYATQKPMLDSCKMLQKQSEAFHTFLWHFFQV